jgi:hypothetical protein
MQVLFPQATTSPVPISLVVSLLSTLLHVSLIPTSHNLPRTYQLHCSATEHSSTYKSHSHNPQQSERHFTKLCCIRFKNYITNHTFHPANTARDVDAVIIIDNIKNFEEDYYVTCDIQAKIIRVETSKQILTLSAFFFHKVITSMQICSNHYLTK